MGLATLRRYHNLPAPASTEKPNEKPIVDVPDRQHTRVPDSNGFRADKLAAQIKAAKK